MRTAKELSELFTKRLSKNSEFKELLEIIKKNSSGKIWLIGGTVSRILTEELYGTIQKDFDFDFLVEKLNEEIVLPEGWSVEYKKFNNPTIKRDNLEADIVPIASHDYIKSNKLKPIIENFFAGVPFTIQALAYDIQEKKIIGDKGIKALNEQLFEVNNLEQAKAMVERKGISIDERMKQKAESMGFKFKLINQ